MPATTTATNTHTPTKRPKASNLNIDWNLVCKQIESGFYATPNHAAKALQVSHTTVSKYWHEYNELKNANPFITDPVALENFKKNRADILAEKQRMIVEAITPEVIQKASLGTLALAKCQLYDKERLERGLSTGNLSVFGHIIGEANQAIVAGDL